MRPVACLIFALMFLAIGFTGCLGTAPDALPPDSPDTHRELPDTLRFDAGELLQSAPGVRTYRWTGTLTGPAAEGRGPEGATIRAPLALPGTVPLTLSMSLESPASAELRLAVVDEYGYAWCEAEGFLSDAWNGADGLACVDREVAPLGWERLWAVEVSTENSAEADIPFEVELLVRTAPGPVREAVTPAGLAEIRSFQTEADDGTPLRGHVYLPRGEGPFGTVLHFSPYWNGGRDDQTEDQATETAGRRTIRWSSAGHLGVLLDAGFAVALVNLRGSGESGGCPTLFDLERDGADAHAVIEALAAEPWSNGRVGMMGISWHGYSQYAAAAAQPHSLKALAPASAILDHWLLWTRYGAPLDLGLYTTGLAFYGLNAAGNGGWTSLSGDRSPDRVTCPEHAEGALAWEAISETGDDTPFWQARNAYDAIADSDVPMLVTNGLITHAEGHVLQIEGLWPLLPEGSHLMLGQWGHAYPNEYGADRYLTMLVDWFDDHLRGGPQKVHPGVTYQDRDGAWHEADAWPPQSLEVELFLSEQDLTPDASAVHSSEQTFQTLENVDPHPSECPFWAVYASPPLPENATLAGNFEVDLTVSSTEVDGNFAVFLWHAEEVMACDEDFFGDGTERIVGRALTDLRHRGHLRQGEPFPVGSEAVVKLRSHPFAADVPAGHRLVLAVGGDSASELRNKALLPTITVHTGDGHEGSLRLPIVDGEVRFE